MRDAKLVPELICLDIARSLRFYTDVLGFTVVYQRSEERFAYLDRDGAQLMLDQSTDRRWVAAELTPPYGRGVNFEIEVTDVRGLHASVLKAAAPIYLPLEDKWYRANAVMRGNRQFIVQDPDGYLLRFAEDLGERPT